MELRDFDRSRKLECHDCKEEVLSFRPEDDTIDRTMIYQALILRRAKDGVAEGAVDAIAERYGPRSGQEADSCGLAEEVYARLWEPALLKICRSGDTLNSWKTTVHELFAPLKEDLKKRPGLRELERLRYPWSIRAGILFYSVEREAFKGVIRSAPGAEHFLSVCYTIGNFLPVPPAFNVGRGFGSPSRDYFDLALLCIYQYYSAKDAGARFDLSWLLPSVSQDGIKACEAWLDYFPSWDAFVEGSFLQDFVHSTSGGYGMPKELWRGHFSGRVMPQGDQREAFFTNASAWISARGARLAIALEKRRRAAGHAEEGRVP